MCSDVMCSDVIAKRANVFYEVQLLNKQNRTECIFVLLLPSKGGFVLL